MIRAIPRASVDIKPREIASIIFCLMRPSSSLKENLAERFESAFAEYVGTRGAVSFSSGRAATFFALKSLGLAEGDEVIMPAFTFWVDAAMVVLAGLKPVFVDVDVESANIVPDQIESKITARTKVLFITHLNGLPVDMKKIVQIAYSRNLRIIEDCARSCGVKIGGRRLGTSDIGMFSFGFGKNLFLFGGGGMLASNDELLLEHLRSMKKEFRRVSRADLFRQVTKGLILTLVNRPLVFRFSLFPLFKAYHVRKNKLAARLLRPKKTIYEKIPSLFFKPMGVAQARQGLFALSRLDDRNGQITQNSQFLREALSGIPGLQTFRVRESPSHEMLYFSLLIENKKELMDYLYTKKIEIEEESASDLTRHELFREYAQDAGYPNAARLDQKMMFLPNHPGLRKNDFSYIVQKIRDFYGEKTGRGS